MKLNKTNEERERTNDHSTLERQLNSSRYESAVILTGKGAFFSVDVHFTHIEFALNRLFANCFGCDNNAIIN